MQALFEIVLPVFVVIGVGYIATWRGLFSESAIDAIVKFTQNIAIPCLLFRAISEVDIGGTFNAPLIICYYFGAVLSFFIAYVGARKFFNRNPADAVAIAFCGFFSNTILLGLPITERAYGPEALTGNFAIIAFHAPLCYMLGVTAMEFAHNRSSSITERSTRVFYAMFRNPFVIAIALGFFVNFTKLPLPGPIIN
ncbi:MAG: AEC family transporter, partial [Boseongicola sp.]